MERERKADIFEAILNVYSYFEAILNVYSHRVDQRDSLMQVKSFGMAIANRLVEDKKWELESAMVALERRQAKLPIDYECEFALAKYAPGVFKMAKYCDECGVWRGHSLSCSKE